MVEEESSKIDLLVCEAQEYLSTNPQDSFHEIEHHRRTWENSLKIIEKEKITDIDLEVLETICWWRDVCITSSDMPSSGKRISELTAEYISENFEEEQKEKVYDSIKNHEFGSNPKYPEGKILQDADKLDFFSKERVEIALKDLQKGRISKQNFVQTLKSAKDILIPHMRERFNFEYAKLCYDQNASSFILYLEKVLGGIK